MCQSVKPVGARPVLCKINKQQVDGCPNFQPILSAFETLTYSSAQILFSILNPLSKNEYTFKDSFQLAEDIFVQDPTLPMGSLDICVNQLFENTDTVEGFTKPELKQVLCLATKESDFIFNGLLHKQVNGGAMG